MAINTLPPIGPRTRKDERKGAVGFLSALLSKLGLGGSAGSGAAAGGASWGASAGHGALFGGLMATKAGLIALVLAGTTVAAGVGIVGNQIGVFGTVDAARDGLPSIFDSLRGNRRTAAAAKPGDTTGTVSSLGYVSEANRGQLGDPISAEQTQTADAGSGSITAPAVPDNNNGVANTTSAKMPAMKGFSGSSSAGGSMAGASASRGTGSGSGDGDGQSSSPGSTAVSQSGMRSTSANARMTPGRKSSAISQLHGVRSDNMRALKASTPSSSQAGATYDGGGARAAGIAGPGGISGGGQGAGGQGVDPGVNPNAAATPKTLPPPPQPGPGKDVTPWKWAMNVAMGALALAMILLMAANMFRSNPMVLKALAAAATAAGAVATAMGVVLMTTYKQTMQGGMFAAIGAIITFAAGKMLFDAMAGEEANAKANAAAQTTANDVNARLANHPEIAGEGPQYGWTAETVNGKATLVWHGEGPVPPRPPTIPGYTFTGNEGGTQWAIGQPSVTVGGA